MSAVYGNHTMSDMDTATVFLLGLLTMPHKPISVFYGGQYCGSYANLRELREGFSVDSDVYQGGIIYVPISPHEVKWYNMDLTPILLVDVPPQLKMLVYLHNL